MGYGGVKGLECHQDIATVLDEARQQGLISDYLVSWRGRCGRLSPRVTVWRRVRGDDIRVYLGNSLFGLVSKAQIIVLDDEPSRRRDRADRPTKRLAAMAISPIRPADAPN